MVSHCINFNSFSEESICSGGSLVCESCVGGKLEHMLRRGDILDRLEKDADYMLSLELGDANNRSNPFDDRISHALGLPSAYQRKLTR
jgi:hypothetical protein